ncbi:MAG: hypothetical protein RLZ04_2246 [Actinomycetota bacterium]
MTPRPLLATLAALAVVGCSADDPSGDSTVAADPQAAAVAACSDVTPLPAGTRPSIAVTVAPITSMVANVVGDLADVTGMVPEGTNSHTFEPPPSIAATLERADVVFSNGLVLEEPTKDLAEAHLRDSATLCELGTSVLPAAEYIYDFSFPREGGKPNPHLWTDPTLASAYVERIRDVMAALDPTNADAYRTNATAYLGRLAALDEAVRTASATMTPEQRQLLTYHDAYAYFSRTYDWTVIGAIQPSSFDEPTAKEIADLIAQVESSGVSAIFGSEVFPSPVLEQIGAETGVAYVDVLRDDDLPGAPGEPQHSFLGLMQFDYVTMVEALGGDASAIASLDVSDVTTDRAEYPQ